MPFTIGNYVQKTLSTTSGFLRAAALLLAGAGIVGGAILGYGVTRPVPASNANLTDENIAVNIYAKELSSGCVDAGTATGCVQILVGVTNNGFIFTKTGGLIVGSLASPKIVLSGGLLRIGGGYPTAGEELAVVGDMSGSTLRVDGLGAATTIATTGAVPCIKAGGLIGYMTRSATGTLLATCN